MFSHQPTTIPQPNLATIITDQVSIKSGSIVVVHQRKVFGHLWITPLRPQA